MSETNELDSICGISDDKLTELFKKAIRIDNEIKRIKDVPIAGYDTERNSAYLEIRTVQDNMPNNQNKLPEIIMFAGPNGFGKSTITKFARIIEPYINADDIMYAIL